MEKLRIIFMGTPSFAVGILDTIIQNNYTVVAVVTAVDKPAGRGQQIKHSDVKEYALQKNIPILQPTNLKDPAFIEQLQKLNANLQIVVAFRMLPQVVWQMPKLGTFNLHASLLPNYRGAAPINWAIINGETKTGVTTFFIDDKIDTGAIILKKEIEIKENENAGELHDKLMNLGSIAVLETLSVIENQTVQTTVQTENEYLKTAHKLHKDNCKINWSLSGTQIYNHIRGLSPFPTAWTTINDNQNSWDVKIYEAKFSTETHQHQIGKIFSTKKEIKIAVIDGFIEITVLQFPGKKKLTPQELLNGLILTEKAIAL